METEGWVICLGLGSGLGGLYEVFFSYCKGRVRKPGNPAKSKTVKGAISRPVQPELIDVGPLLTVIYEILSLFPRPPLWRHSMQKASPIRMMDWIIDQTCP